LVLQYEGKKYGSLRLKATPDQVGQNIDADFNGDDSWDRYVKVTQIVNLEAIKEAESKIPAKSDSL
jgi:hypothetical protein